MFTFFIKSIKNVRDDGALVSWIGQDHGHLWVCSHFDEDLENVVAAFRGVAKQGVSCEY